MTRRPRYRPPDAEKDAQQERQAKHVEAQVARIAALQVKLATPRRTSRNSYSP